MNNNEEKIPVVVTTERAPFFGYADPSQQNASSVTLHSARHCLYWSREIGGVFGLAEIGPNGDCRISTTAPEVTIHNVTAFLRCTEAAAKAWREAKSVGK
jgi:hypothetical protein